MEWISREPRVKDARKKESEVEGMRGEEGRRKGRRFEGRERRVEEADELVEWQILLFCLFSMREMAAKRHGGR